MFFIISIIFHTIPCQKLFPWKQNDYLNLTASWSEIKSTGHKIRTLICLEIQTISPRVEAREPGCAFSHGPTELVVTGLDSITEPSAARCQLLYCWETVSHGLSDGHHLIVTLTLFLVWISQTTFYRLNFPNGTNKNKMQYTYLPVYSFSEICVFYRH